MVVDGLAFDVGVIPAGQVHPLDCVELGEQLQGPEDRGPANVQLPLSGVINQVGGAEMAAPLGDQLGDHAARLSQPIAGQVEGRDDCRWFRHAYDDTTNRARLGIALDDTESQLIRCSGT